MSRACAGVRTGDPAVARDRLFVRRDVVRIRPRQPGVVPGAAIAALSQSLAIGPDGFGRQHPGDALRSLASFDVRQLECIFAGEPMYLATLAGGDTRIIRADGVPATEIGVSRLAEAVSRAAGLEERADLQVALHSLDFPWLYSHRPVWDIVVIMFMLGGSALSITSVILGWRVLTRTIGRPRG